MTLFLTLFILKCRFELTLKYSILFFGNLKSMAGISFLLLDPEIFIVKSKLVRATPVNIWEALSLDGSHVFSNQAELLEDE